MYPQGVQTIPVISGLRFHILNFFKTEKQDQAMKLVARIQEELRSKFNWGIANITDKFVFRYYLNTTDGSFKDDYVCARIVYLIFVVPCIMLNSEINPTRCNNCVYSSQWLYSTCFG